MGEFLLEKAIQNTRVVGHAFFWSLKANLDNPSELEAQERFFLMLERFLMCCGQFKNELYKQNLVNEALIDLQVFVNDQLLVKKNTKDGT